MSTGPSYHPFLNEMAQIKWKKLLGIDVIEEIVHLAENHPYYVNAICRRLWRSDEPPTLSAVRNSWDDYVNKQRDWISNDLASLTLNRRKVLTALAYQPTHLVQGQEFSVNVGLTPSSINKAIVDLQKLDMVYQDKLGDFRVLDPSVAYFIRQHAIK